MSVSFVIAARNEATRIERCIRSIQLILDTDDEVVVADDGSVDDTAAIIRSIRDPRIKLIQNARPAGRATARNEAIAASRSNFIAIQDADDVALRNRLQPMTLLLNDRNLVAASGQCITVTDSGRAWYHSQYPLRSDRISDQLAGGVMSICHTGSVVRKSALIEAGGYDPAYVRSQDLDLFRRLASIGPMANTERRVVLYTHNVLLPWAYYSRTRAYRQIIKGETYSPAIAAAAYVPSMLRRVLTFQRTQGRANLDLQREQ
jgi:glycosyltransferase involved in cell wall biosynthesis